MHQRCPQACSAHLPCGCSPYVSKSTSLATLSIHFLLLVLKNFVSGGRWQRESRRRLGSHRSVVSRAAFCPCIFACRAASRIFSVRFAHRAIVGISRRESFPELGVAGDVRKGHVERRKEKKGNRIFEPYPRKEAKGHFTRCQGAV